MFTSEPRRWRDSGAGVCGEGAGRTQRRGAAGRGRGSRPGALSRAHSRLARTATHASRHRRTARSRDPSSGTLTENLCRALRIRAIFLLVGVPHSRLFVILQNGWTVKRCKHSTRAAGSQVSCKLYVSPMLWSVPGKSVFYRIKTVN